VTRRQALPPRAAEWLLEWALPLAEGREIAEDLRELFAHRLQERGARATRLWYWKQVAIFVYRAGLFRRETGLEAESLRADVAYALRSLRRAPGFTAVAVVTQRVRKLRAAVRVGKACRWQFTRPLIRD